MPEYKLDIELSLWGGDRDDAEGAFAAIRSELTGSLSLADVEVFRLADGNIDVEGPAEWHQSFCAIATFQGSADALRIEIEKQLDSRTEDGQIGSYAITGCYEIDVDDGEDGSPEKN
jgi:hypothetical protein